MSNELANPLKQLLAQTAKLPVCTGETASFHQRFDRAGTATVILADASGSMDERAGTRRKIEHLREALTEVWSQIVEPVLFRFDSQPVQISQASKIGEPSGGTAMHLALDAAAELRPERTIVISDGQPDDATAALAAAERLPGRIDVIYCGPDSDASAVEFMRRLARTGTGQCVVHDLVRHAGAGLALRVHRVLLLGGPAS